MGIIKKNRFLVVFVLFFFVLSSGSCASTAEHQKREYGVLESAVTFSSDKVIGEYGDVIPEDFKADKFMLFVKDKIPDDYYETLSKYKIELRPKGKYYLLLIFDSGDKQLILFDYSCTPEVDGPVFLQPEKYDIQNLELYDTCK